MLLSRTERWILYNQLSVLEILHPDEAQHYCDLKEAVQNGYEYEYPPDYIYKDEHILSREACSEVHEILGMFQALDWARTRGAVPEVVDQLHISFWGFDGNHEPELLGYVRYIQRLGRYMGIHGGDAQNSHMPAMGRYRRMLAAYREAVNPVELTATDVARIAAASMAP